MVDARRCHPIPVSSPPVTLLQLSEMPNGNVTPKQVADEEIHHRKQNLPSMMLINKEPGNNTDTILKFS